METKLIFLTVNTVDLKHNATNKKTKKLYGTDISMLNDASKIMLRVEP
jgi:hypothetical protein